MSQKSKAEEYRIAKQQLLAAARIDINVFCQYVLIDDTTGERIQQSNTHRKMQKYYTENDRLILWSHTEAGKTVQIAVARTIFEIGNDPRARFAIITSGSNTAVRIVTSIARHIKHNTKVQEVFPHLKPGVPWNEKSLRVISEGYTNFANDPTVTAVGLFTNFTGARITHLIGDDILNPKNTETKASRKKTYDWIISAEVMGRLLPGAKVVFIGNAYTPDDALHIFSKQDHWKIFRLPVVDKRGRSTWPEKWPLSRIKERKKDLVLPREFNRQMLCIASSDVDSRFKQSSLDACCARGRGLLFLSCIEDVLGTPWPLPPGSLDAMPSWPNLKQALEDDGMAITTAKVDVLQDAAKAAAKNNDEIKNFLSGSLMQNNDEEAGEKKKDLKDLCIGVDKEIIVLPSVAPSIIELEDDAPDWLKKHQVTSFKQATATKNAERGNFEKKLDLENNQAVRVLLGDRKIVGDSVDTMLDGLEDQVADGNILKVAGAPEGIFFSKEAESWLSLWLERPGTPYRNEQGWPVHPYTVSDLHRMGIFFETGVDLAMSKTDAADFTVIYTVMVYPPSHGRKHPTRRLVEVQRGKYYGDEIVDRIIDTHERFDSNVTVENNVGQMYIIHFVKKRLGECKWLRGLQTGRKKMNSDYGVESIAPDLTSEEWCFPVPAQWHPERDDSSSVLEPILETHFNELLYFSPADHTGDTLMAMWFVDLGVSYTYRKKKKA